MSLINGPVIVEALIHLTYKVPVEKYLDEAI